MSSIELESRADNVNVQEYFKQSFLVDRELKNQSIKELQGELDTITDEYRKNQTEGIYNFLNNLDRRYIVFYFIGLIVIYIFVDKINFTVKNIISLIIALSIIYFINDRNEKLNIDDMKKIDIKLATIFPQPRYFYLDSKIIDIFFSLQDFRDDSADIYDSLIVEIDTFLELTVLIRDLPKDYNKMYTLLKQYRKKIMNKFQSFIHNIDTYNKITYDKFHNAMENLHFILNVHMIDIKNYINNKIDEEGIDRTNIEILFDDEEQPSPDDFENEYDFY